MVVVVVVWVRVAVAHGGPATQRVRGVPTGAAKNSGDTISCFNMSSLRRGHADRLCNIPSFTCDTLLRGCAIMDIWWAYVKPVGLVYFGRTVRRHTQVLAAGRRHPGLPWCTYGMYPPDTPIMRVP